MKTEALAIIGRKAVEHHQLELAHKTARRKMSEAYIQWKGSVGLDRVESGTDDWDEMMMDTKPQFLAFKRAKASMRNAKQRLDRAVVSASRVGIAA